MGKIDSRDAPDKIDEPLLNKLEQLTNMCDISSIIAAGAKSFFKAEYLYMAAYVVLFSGVLLMATQWKTTVSFVVGAIWRRNSGRFHHGCLCDISWCHRSSRLVYVGIHRRYCLGD